MKKHTLLNILKGCLIGIAMIIPGISGGTVAVIVNIYEQLLDAINNLKSDFKKSFSFLFPIFLGIIISFLAMYFPIKYALNAIPLQTICLFAGLMIGSIPQMVSSILKNKFKKIYIVSFIISFIVVIAICFIPNMNATNLSSNMSIFQYIILLLIGIIASMALIIPGISGSMLLLILGYYKPLLNTISNIKVDPLHSLLVLCIFGIGLIIGFFTIAKLIKFLFDKFPLVTNFAITGFVIGSIIAIFLTIDYSTINLTFATIFSSIVVCILGIIISFSLILKEKKVKNNAS